MTDKTISLTRRRALVALGTIGVGGAAAGAGTFAAFSDNETTTGNLTAGTLDISTDTTTLSFNTSGDIKPGDTGKASVTLTKSGSVTGNLSIEVTNVTSDDAESNDGTATDGSLDDQVELQLWIDADQDGSANNSDVGLNSDSSYNSGSKGTAAFASNFNGTTWAASDSGAPSYFTGFSDPVDFYVEYKFVDDNNDSSLNNNNVQGHDLTVDFKFTLTQQ